MAYVAFTGLRGEAILINTSDENVAELTAVPTGSLPTGVANGTNIDFDDGRRIQVQGTPAATATTLSGGGVAPSNAVYVDLAGNNATGARGSAAFPFLTMAAALAVAQSGDEALVSPGTYSGAFSIPAVANLIIRGSGSWAGDTVLTAANAVDVCTLNAANRSVLFDNIQIAGATTGRAIVGTGATAGGAWLSTGFGLALQDVVLSSAAGVALVLTDANAVLLRDTQISAGGATFTTCSVIVVQSSSISGAVTNTWDDTDANKPTTGASVGLQLLAGSAISGTTTLGGQARLDTRSGSSLAGLTGNALSVAAGPVSPSISVKGQVGAVDFQSTAAKILPDSVLGAYTVDFSGCEFTGASALFKSATTALTINLTGAVSKATAGFTITADVMCNVLARGASFNAPIYTTPGASGAIDPPFLAGTIDISAGGALVKTWAQLGATLTGTPYAGLVRTVTAPVSVSLTSAVQAADAVVPVAGKVTTGFTATSTAQAGNVANWRANWP